MIKNNHTKKNIELPICITPEVRTYSYYALPLCIIMAEERIGKRIAEFEICETDQNNWTSIGMKKEGTYWKYESEDAYNRSCNGCIYRPLPHNEGYVHIKIKFQLNTAKAHAAAIQMVTAPFASVPQAPAA